MLTTHARLAHVSCRFNKARTRAQRWKEMPTMSSCSDNSLASNTSLIGSLKKKLKAHKRIPTPSSYSNLASFRTTSNNANRVGTSNGRPPQGSHLGNAVPGPPRGNTVGDRRSCDEDVTSSLREKLVRGPRFNCIFKSLSGDRPDSVGTPASHQGSVDPEPISSDPDTSSSEGSSEFMVEPREVYLPQSPPPVVDDELSRMG